jgi:acyl-CoA thioester hydrolase
MTVEEFTQTYPAHVTFPVAWGEMDAFGHVNNTVFFRYFENARIALFASWPLDAVRTSRGLGPILAETRCRFRRPLTFPDQVTVGARVTRIEADRAWIEHAIWSHSASVVAAVGEAVVVCFDYDAQKKAPWPDALREELARRLEG